MFLNILRISASNVLNLDIFHYLLVFGVQLLFSIHNNQPRKRKDAFLNFLQERHIIINEKLDTKGDVSLMNISRETNIFMIFCSIQNKRSSPFHSLSMFLTYSSILGVFQPGVLTKMFL